MFVDRVLVILIELQQAAGMRHRWQDTFQHAQLVQVAQDCAELGTAGQQVHEAGSGFRCQ